jgi:hypothetical protein
MAPSAAEQTWLAGCDCMAKATARYRSVCLRPEAEFGILRKKFIDTLAPTAYLDRVQYL